MLLYVLAIDASAIRGFPVPCSPVGPDLKPVEWAPKRPPSRDTPGLILDSLETPLGREGFLFRGRFTNFRSSPKGLSSKGVYTAIG